MNKILYLIGSPLLLISVAAHIYVRIRLCPKDDSDLDDYYYEFEEQHPAYAKYLFWSRITFAAIALATLLLFLAIAV
jgi:type IV secretory pathway VirB3-like protein